MRTHRLLLGVSLVGAVAIMGAVNCHKQQHSASPTPRTMSYAYEPQIVAVDDGVWVLRDSDTPIYYVDDYYYRYTYSENRWYRSTSHAGGWIEIDAAAVPGTIAARDHQRYVRYRGDANAIVRPAPNIDVGESEPERRKDFPPTAVGGGPRP